MRLDLRCELGEGAVGAESPFRLWGPAVRTRCYTTLSGLDTHPVHSRHRGLDGMWRKVRELGKQCRTVWG